MLGSRGRGTEHRENVRYARHSFVMDLSIVVYAALGLSVCRVLTVTTVWLQM